MSHQNTEMDVESLQKQERRRGGFLDVFLVVSVVFLFVAVTALAVYGALALRDVQSRLTHLKTIEINQTPVSQQLKSTESSSIEYKNFAYLEANSSKLENSTMHWAEFHQGEGRSVGKNFLFDRVQQSLTPSNVGTYFMYINLNLTCTYKCSAGLLTVRVNDKLTCDVQLPEMASTTPVSRKCWTVSRIANENLITKMIVPKEGLKYWKLELNSSGFGMFLVD
ncbi:uncharacterized protein LOC113161376 [Anabas testudineus]|uniref:uncharacterized protein LOC113161376 n=1 Tax=Anabas testudineus TaxID=64144 RepID=UPI000E45E093|nr:uncharacterized protein LOC113161376 [Anabas testudineus]